MSAAGLFDDEFVAPDDALHVSLDETPTTPIALPDEIRLQLLAARQRREVAVPVLTAYAEPVRHGRRAYRKPPTSGMAIVLAATMTIGATLGSLGTMAVLVIW